MRSQRQLRVGEMIRHALADVLARGDVPWPASAPMPMITVTEVQVSPDLRNATAYIMPMGTSGEQSAKEVVRQLNDTVRFFRHALAGAVKLRYVPTLVFRADNTLEYAGNIERILHDPAVAKDLAKPAPQADDDEDDFQ